MRKCRLFRWAHIRQGGHRFDPACSRQARSFATIPATKESRCESVGFFVGLISAKADIGSILLAAGRREASRLSPLLRKADAKVSAFSLGSYPPRRTGVRSCLLCSDDAPAKTMQQAGAKLRDYPRFRVVSFSL
jgi:hypothetical protein